jgi:hypothetical protein
MATANSSLNVTELDFDTIKSNLKTYLKNQDKLKDYNFEGSIISTLLDVLAYNTHYNAFYLNMVSNEMFLDTALKRGSVISHAKVLDYMPRSAKCSTAKASVTFTGVTSGEAYTLPKFVKFFSKYVDGVNYQFVSADQYTENAIDGSVTFNITLYQGQAIGYDYELNLNGPNDKIIKLPDSNIDTSTLIVVINEFGGEGGDYLGIFENATDYLTLDGLSKVYFLQESLDGYYEIYFGDGILGQDVSGSRVAISYIIPTVSVPDGISTFALIDDPGFIYDNVIIDVTEPSSGGYEKETIDSVKFNAPKSFAMQKRAVTKNDYITAIQQNKFGYSFDAVNVWGGEEYESPVFGKVFISIKPSGGYALTTIQKQKLLDDVIKPISVLTVKPTIIEPDYTYLKLNVNVYYDPKLTLLTASQLQSLVLAKIYSFAETTLNTFNSTFMEAALNSYIFNLDTSIITNDVSVQLQKKILPDLVGPKTYNLYFNTELKRGLFGEGVTSYPSLSYKDKDNQQIIIDGMYLEEVPTRSFGIDSIIVINPGSSYQYTPTVTILGDGTGATAVAKLSPTGSIDSIQLTNAGSGYTSAIVEITPASGDTTGILGAALAKIAGSVGSLRLYYNTSTKIKTIYSENAGSIDYKNGVITLDSFNPYALDNPLGQLTITTTPVSTIFSSAFNRILTLDPFDSSAVTVNVIAKTK